MLYSEAEIVELRSNVKIERFEGKNMAKEGSESNKPIGQPPKEEFLAVQLLFRIEQELKIC